MFESLDEMLAVDEHKQKVGEERKYDVTLALFGELYELFCDTGKLRLNRKQDNGSYEHTFDYNGMRLITVTDFVLDVETEGTEWLTKWLVYPFHN